MCWGRSGMCALPISFVVESALRILHFMGMVVCIPASAVEWTPLGQYAATVGSGTNVPVSAPAPTPVGVRRKLLIFFA